MLKSLYVKNLALIKEQEVDFSSGLNVLSGETGAGKTILLESILLALGKRAEKDKIRTGTDFCFSELVFQLSEDEEKEIAALGMTSEDGKLIIQRKITETDSVSKVNGETVTLKTLSALASVLLCVHGQHETDRLLDEKNHIELLDAYGDTGYRERKEEYYRIYTKFREMKAETAAFFEKDADTLKDELSFLGEEIKELRNAGLKPGEEEKLRTDFSEMTKSFSSAENLREALSLLSDQNRQPVNTAFRKLQEAEKQNPEVKAFREELSEAMTVLSDVESSLSDFLSGNEFDEALYRKTEERLSEIHALTRKYRLTEEGLLQKEKELSEKYEELSRFYENRNQIEEELLSLQKELKNAGEKLHESRTELGTRFSEALVRILRELNFPNIRFEVRTEKSNRYTKNGCDEVCFFCSANPGEPLKSLTNVASGGELSRIMLGIKTLLSDKDRVFTLIFDEIDTGISGVTASKVGTALEELSKSHQIILISHLPQIVAKADTHFLIEKSSFTEETFTGIRKLSEEESIAELSRLLSDGRITEAALGNAREMKRKTV